MSCARFVRHRTHFAVTVLAAVVTLPALSSCSSDPLSISCGDYISKDADTQLKLAVRWGAPNRDNPGPGAEFAGPTFKSQLLEYCPAHKEVKLKDIVVRYG